MNRICLFAVMIILVAPNAALAQTVTPISQLHFNDSTGATLMLDQLVTIQGIVTVPSGVFNTTRTEVYLQDATGGMNLFSFTPVATYNAGDEVKVTGTVIQFNGLTEVEPISVELIATGQPEPDPLLITCAELAASYDASTDSEPNESLLVRLNNVTWDPGTLALTDDTGTAMMYIDSDTGIPDPVGEFNVVGVIKQYDPAGPPWFAGYEVLPRYVSDISYGVGPQFVTYPVQTGVAMGGATLSWTTDIDCETVLEYGVTTSFELPPLELGNSTTTHEAVLSGLDSATVYYCRAVARDASNTVYSPTVTIVAPSVSSSGEINVYFSRSVDTSYSTGTDAVQTNIAQRMIDLIDAATTSIDFCFYSFTHDDVATALVGAHTRGVQVQVIYENFDTVINTLLAAGIEVRTDPDDVHDNTHNKFAVFDYRDADETNDVVWTGSWNASYNGTFSNAENAVELHDSALAAAYTIEFEEMWDGSFSTMKEDNTPHLFLIGGRPVEVYMSPSDDVPDKLSKLINTGDNDLLFAIYSFTHEEVSTPLINKFNAGVAVRGVFDGENSAYDGSEYPTLLALGMDVILDDVEQGGADDLMHHKYLLVDPVSIASDPSVVTGSYNWSYTAATYKDENILIVHDETITNIFFQEWMARYLEAGGTWDGGDSGIFMDGFESGNTSAWTAAVP